MSNFSLHMLHCSNTCALHLHQVIRSIWRVIFFSSRKSKHRRETITFICNFDSIFLCQAKLLTSWKYPKMQSILNCYVVTKTFRIWLIDTPMTSVAMNGLALGAFILCWQTWPELWCSKPSGLTAAVCLPLSCRGQLGGAPCWWQPASQGTQDIPCWCFLPGDTGN